jgi:hypothetical protein
VIEAQDSAPRGPGNDVGPYSVETFHPFASRLSPSRLSRRAPLSFNSVLLGYR